MMLQMLVRLLNVESVLATEIEKNMSLASQVSFGNSMKGVYLVFYQ